MPRPITSEDLYRLHDIEELQFTPDGRYIAYVRSQPQRESNDYERNIWLVARDGAAAPRQLTRGGKDSQPRWSPDGGTLAFVRAARGERAAQPGETGDKAQIYLLPVFAPGGEARLLTRAQNGAATPRWSPDGRWLAFLSPSTVEERAEEDEGNEPAEPRDALERKQRAERSQQDERERLDPRVIERIPYRQGTSYLDGRSAQIYVIASEENDGEAASARRLTASETPYTALEWAADGRSLLTARSAQPESDEPFRTMALYRIALEDGQETRLTPETEADGIAYSNFMPQAAPDGSGNIAYLRIPRALSSRANVRLALLPADGAPAHELCGTGAGGALERSVNQCVWAVDGQSLYFSAGDRGDAGIYRVGVAAKEAAVYEQVVGGRQEVQSFAVAADGALAYARSTPEAPPELWLQEPDGSPGRPLTRLHEEFLKEVTVSETRELRWHSADGTEIQGWVLLPVGYEEGQRYPLALNIHGGPHAMWGPSARTMWHEWQCHAAAGYVVLYCNPRGSDGYGEAFRDGAHRAWGEKDMPDVMAGVDEVLARGWVDEGRMAITGGSYGGFLTSWIIGHTTRFAAAVTQRGVYALPAFVGTTDIPSFIENEFGAWPWQDYAYLWEHSPLRYAPQIRTPTLIIHSENDYRVPLSEAEQLFLAIRKATDTPVRLLQFPRDGHELSRSGEPRHRVQRLQAMLEWFDRYCKAETSED
ncbi:MAG: S9 family peptidase [Anaerolineaceae bacterium]|nr:S9 family peptidase [Anaerolineaceae bacterium]